MNNKTRTVYRVTKEGYVWDSDHNDVYVAEGRASDICGTVAEVEVEDNHAPAGRY